MADVSNISALRASKYEIELRNKKAAKDVNALRDTNNLLSKQIIKLEINAPDSELLKELKRQRSQNESKITELLDELMASYKQLEVINSEIRFPNPKAYIEEQVSKIVVEFSEYVQQNANQLSSQPPTTFYFKPNSYQTLSRCNYSYYAPTGDMGLYISDNEKPLISSKDFPFRWMPLFKEREMSWYWIAYADESMWFTSYREMFCNMFFEHLQKKFDNITFKLSICKIDNSVTLDLV